MRKNLIKKLIATLSLSLAIAFGVSNVAFASRGLFVDDIEKTEWGYFGGGISYWCIIGTRHNYLAETIEKHYRKAGASNEGYGSFCWLRVYNSKGQEVGYDYNRNDSGVSYAEVNHTFFIGGNPFLQDIPREEGGFGRT